MRILVEEQIDSDLGATAEKRRYELADRTTAASFSCEASIKRGSPSAQVADQTRLFVQADPRLGVRFLACCVAQRQRQLLHLRMQQCGFGTVLSCLAG